MAEFEVYTDRIKKQISSYQVVGGSLERLCMSLREVQGSLSIKGNYVSAVKKSLNQAGKGIQQVKGQIKQLEECLTETTAFYESTEKSLIQSEKQIEKIVDQSYTGLPDSRKNEIKEYLKQNPKKEGQSTEDYINFIKSGLIEIPGLTVMGVELFLNDLADVYKNQGKWLSEEAGKALAYTDDVAQYMDDVANAANVANKGSRLAGLAKTASGIGVALDFVLQVASGENVVDAAIKTGAHVAISAGVAFLAGNPVGLAAVGVAVSGYVLGKAFDWVYDNRNMIFDKATSFIEDVGDAISGFFSGVTAVFT